MGMFDEQLTAVHRLVERWKAAGSLKGLETRTREPWPPGRSLVLNEDTALEFGNPGLASVSMLLWGEEAPPGDCGVSLVGPDLAGAEGAGLPFAQVLVAWGRFDDEYDSYRDLRDAVYDTRLEGLSVRTMPSRQTVWCKVSKEALASGLSLADLGGAYTRALEEVDGVTAAAALFVTSSAEDVALLADVASGAQRLVDAMMKMYQEQNFDCETCEYQDVCDTVMDLKKMRNRLAEDRAG